MTAVELDAFLRSELPLAFDYDDLRIEHADGKTCLIRQRFRKNMLRLAVGEVALMSGTSPEPIAHVTATYSIPNKQSLVR